jgi:leader peptidase (prepilin peptidase) / N-methyltransferase
VTPAFAPLAIAAALGLVVGSFLNVCIYRLPRGESINLPASHCPLCGHPLRWRDNVPVLGYLLLGGRCRHCRGPISVQYPLVEVATAGLFVAAVSIHGVSWLGAARVVFGCAMIVLCMIDLEHQILPNVITLPGILAGLAFSLVASPGFRDAVIGVLAGGGILFLIAEVWYRLRRIEAMGMGDVKMLAMIGAFLGWKLMIVTLFLSSVVGAVVSVALLASRRATWTTAVPYGVFLAGGAVAASFAGDALIAWYLSIYWPNG